jgi:hypothetical protein
VTLRAPDGTDGDGFDDGSEVAVRSDPIDSESFPQGATPVPALPLVVRALWPCVDARGDAA